MPTTYEPIATTTLGSATSTITFSSIPGTYTDLRLIFIGTSSGGATTWRLRFNSDSGANYSRTILYGTGATAASSRGTAQTGCQAFAGFGTATPQFNEFDIFSYTASVNKTVLHSEVYDQNGSGTITKQVHLWQNTATITQIDLVAQTNNFAIGTTATLYGILKA